MFEHKGHKITVKENGSFETVINGTYVVKSSIAAVKKAIDSASAFEEFDALHQRNLAEGYVPVRVIGIAKAKGQKSYYNADKWIFKDGKSSKSVVHDTPENRALIDASVTLNDEYEAAKRELEERYESRIEAARDAIRRVTPE